MILDEVVQEIIADDFTAGAALARKGVCDEVQIFFQCIAAIDSADKFHKTPHNIVFEVFLIGDGDAVVLVGQEGLVPAFVPFAACIGKPLHIQRVASEHATHGTGNEGNDLVAHGADVIAALHGFRHIIFAVKHAMHGHILVRHIRRQFVLQAVNVNENAVEFFFVLFELLEAGFTLGLPSSIFLGNQSSHINDSSNSSVNALLIRSQVVSKLVVDPFPSGTAYLVSIQSITR